MKPMLINLISISMCAVALIGCGKKEKSPREGIKQDPAVTDQYQNMLKGSMKSSLGNIHFDENKKVSIESWVKIRFSKHADTTDKFLDCKIKRTGSFEVSESANELKLLVKPKSVKVLDAKFQKKDWGGYFEITEENKHLIQTMCSDFAKQELASTINFKIISISEEHLYLYNSAVFSDFDPKTQRSTANISMAGHDFDDLYIKSNEVNITQEFLKIFQGDLKGRDVAYPDQGQLIEGTMKLKLSSKDEDGVSYDFSRSFNDKRFDCSSSGEFKVFYSVSKGPEIRFEAEDPCLDDYYKGKFESINLRSGYSERDDIYLVLPFGTFNEIVRKAEK